MKKLFILLIAVAAYLLPLSLHSQKYFSNGDHHSMVFMQKTSSGKLIPQVYNYRGDKPFISGDVSNLITENEKPKSNATTHHVVFHFTPDGPDYYLTLTSQTESFTNFFMSPYAEDLPDGYYDLVCTRVDNNQNVMYIILDKFHVYKDMDTTINLASANHQISTKITDELGNQVTESGYPHSYYLDAIIDLGADKRAPYMNEMSSMWMENIMISDIPESMQVRICRAATTLDNKKYTVQFPPVNSITSDTLITNTASSLKCFPQVFNNLQSQVYYPAWGYGVIVNPMLEGYNPPFIVGTLETQTANNWDTLYHYSNPSCDPSLLSFFASYAVLRFDEYLGEKDFFTPTCMMDNTGEMIYSVDGNYPPVSADIVVQPGQVADFGITAPFNLITSQNTPGSDALYFFPRFKAGFNERRYNDHDASTIKIWQQNQLVYSNDTACPQFVNVALASSDECTVVISDSNYTMFDKQGWLKTELKVQIGNQNDPDPPTPVAYKILQGEVTNEVVRGFGAEFRFTAGDYHIDNNGNRIYGNIENVAVYYKTYESDPWILLPVTELTSQLNLISGMPYSADLSPIFLLPGDSVMVDIRIELSDAAGNLNMQDIHPAFLLRDVVTGTVEKEKGSLIIYPNPARDEIFIKCGEKNYTAEIISTQGKVVYRGTDVNRVDVSSFAPGVYLVKIVGKDGVLKDAGKVVVE